MEEPLGVDASTGDGESTKASVSPTQGQRRGIVSRIWRGIFGVRNEDYEKKLQHLSKEEEAVHAKMKKRAQTSRKRARDLIMLCVTFEVVAVGISVTAIRSPDCTGPMRFFRTLPAIFLPGLAYAIYSSYRSLIRMLDRKDQKTLEKLRAERKAKIDELKERTNYYTTQQLIQRYDLDPAAKVAAATILASKLGAESGLNIHIGDEHNKAAEASKSSGIEQAQIRQRKQPSTSGGSAQPSSPNDAVSNSPNHPMVVEHYSGPSPSDGGWISRLAALLVGEDPSQCYALICGNCHKHNGLSRKEDFPHITYYCPHCHALNTSKNAGDKDPLLVPIGKIMREASGSSLLDSASSVETTENIVAETCQELPKPLAD